MNLLMCLLFPALMGRLQIFQSPGLFRPIVEQGEEGGEFRFELSVGVVEGLQEGLVFGEEVATEASLFIDHELDEVVGVADDLVGVIDRGCAALDVLQAKAKNKGEDGQCSDGESEQADQKLVVLPRIHNCFPWAESTAMFFRHVQLNT